MTDKPQRPRRKRGLTPEEKVLWKAVAKTVAPLPGRVPHPASDAEDETKAVVPPSDPKPIKARTPSRAALKPPAPPPLAPIEPRLARTLRRGGEVDARLDLHGFRQDEAHSRLIRFLQDHQTRGSRVVLVITGKGRREADIPMFEERGVLKRLVPIWLAEPVLRNIVIGFSEAAQAHGGAGALYVRLRRSR